MAVFLLIPDLRRLVDIFVRNRAVPSADLNPIRFERRKLRIAQAVCWVAVVGFRPRERHLSARGRDISGRTRIRSGRRIMDCTRSSLEDRLTGERSLSISRTT